MTEAEFAIKFETTEDDNLAFAMHYWENSPSLRKRVLTGRLGWTLAFVLLAVVNIVLELWYWAALMLVAALVYVVFYDRWCRRTFLRRFKRLQSEAKNRSALGNKEMSVGEDGVNLYAETGRSLTKWLGIERIASTADHTFLYVGAGHALVIPKNRVTEGDYETFVVELKRRFEEYKGHQAKDSG
ncbi:MAG: YcxB family protein [Candidatus Zixiibacteriota bacterium]|nr:MAG: YcxB family protein [candidate division Zixibacteria bacterium]